MRIRSINRNRRNVLARAEKMNAHNPSGIRPTWLTRNRPLSEWGQWGEDHPHKLQRDGSPIFYDNVWVPGGMTGRASAKCRKRTEMNRAGLQDMMNG